MRRCCSSQLHLTESSDDITEERKYKRLPNISTISMHKNTQNSMYFNKLFEKRLIIKRLNSQELCNIANDKLRNNFNNKKNENTHKNLGVEIDKKNTSIEYLQNLKRHNLCKPCNIDMNDLKVIVERKHNLNMQLWEAAERGDTEKIISLLQP